MHRAHALSFREEQSPDYRGETPITPSDDTAAEFQEGFWRSSDLGYLDRDGFLFIIDRKKDMIITGGYNVYAAEVEAALAEHPAVVMSAVVGLPNAEWGEAIHAEVILREGAQT